MDTSLEPQQFNAVHRTLRDRLNPIIDKDDPAGVALKRLVLTDATDTKELAE